jgi:hypothetical protein
LQKTGNGLHAHNRKPAANLIVDQHLDHVTQRVAQQHVVVASVAELMQRELDGSFHAKLDLNMGR